MKNIKFALFSIISIFSLVSCNQTFNKNLSTNEIIPDGSIKEVVVVKEVENDLVYSSIEEMISDVKPSVVDINAYGYNFKAAGSGVIVGKSDNSYYVITNHHVIDKANEFSVSIYDNNDNSKEYSASFIGGSPTSDIAVLSIETSDDLVVASFIDDSSKCNVGQDVIAIGNPLGILGGTVTKGIISAKEREVFIDGIGYMNLMQTDSAINSGNSGGALFNVNGNLIGIVNSGYSSYEGLNFAIPANQAKESFSSIVNTYRKNGDNFGYVVGDSNLGINLSEAAIYTSSSLNEQTLVVYIDSLTSNGDGKKADLYDYSSFTSGKYSTFYALIKINDIDVESASQASKLLQQFKAGQTITLTLKTINYKRSGLGFFANSFYYLEEKEFQKEITITQYIYSI